MAVAKLPARVASGSLFVSLVLTVGCGAPAQSGGNPPTSVAPAATAASTSASGAATVLAPTVVAAATAVSGVASSAATPAANAANAAASGGGAACSLANAGDVSAAYGEQFDAGKASSPGGHSACLFTTQGGSGIDAVQLTMASGSEANVFYSANRGAYDATDVSALGDKAFVSNDGGMIGVERGGTTFLVHLVGFEKDTPASLQGKQKAFVQTILAHAH